MGGRQSLPAGRGGLSEHVVAARHGGWAPRGGEPVQLCERELLALHVRILTRRPPFHTHIHIHPLLRSHAQRAAPDDSGADRRAARVGEGAGTGYHQHVPAGAGTGALEASHHQYISAGASPGTPLVEAGPNMQAPLAIIGHSISHLQN